eukprot:gb/GFBE01034731.1/.p1 GENE.gb/GFBE01034731.1/~~gb/GFBE01034731.1/.p1  ORF type:complete len:196 (+),score=48.87 gb/GFBE01034731.1/:1-588(+)
MQWGALLLAAVGVTGGAMASKPSAAELRRFDDSTDCSGKYEVLHTDELDTCFPFFIPAPASIKAVWVNDTAYASYHWQGVQDCSGDQGEFEADFIVNSCVNMGGYSQMRVWKTSPPPSAGVCEVPGDCGRAYQACCLASQIKGAPCNCHLGNGTGTADSADCGTCGKAFVACCMAFDLKGTPCTCGIKDKPSILV